MEEGGYSDQNSDENSWILCPICKTEFNSLFIPYVLSCGHTFCFACLNERAPNYVCFICREPSKKISQNHILLKLLSKNVSPPSLTCEKTHLSEIIAYCSVDEKLLCQNCLTSHITHDFSSLKSSKTQEVIKYKEKIFVENEQKVSKLITSVQNSLNDIAEIKKENEHINKVLYKLNEAKEMLIADIIKNTSACINEIGVSGSLNELETTENSLRVFLCELLSMQPEISDNRTKFLAADDLGKLGWKNKEILFNFVEPKPIEIDKTKFPAPLLGSINYIESIFNGHLCFKKKRKKIE
ncbi:unnamed protein product [Blepharisma stoltei]|uniref:Uncharacterized protein n=1 Tax=Blepharisma stoltei TaxID=1481888 RepID=A0AAU9IAH1_9CILI|nr:unnamed protein product [Blepharisma stoltei]